MKWCSKSQRRDKLGLDPGLLIPSLHDLSAYSYLFSCPAAYIHLHFCFVTLKESHKEKYLEIFPYSFQWLGE